MNSSLNCNLEPSTSLSHLSSNCDYQIMKSLLDDSNTVVNLELIGNHLCENREREETILMLSNEARDKFLEDLKNPPKPNESLKEAFEFYYNKKLQG